MKNNNAQEFVLYGGRIIPKIEGSDYALVNGKVYTIKQDQLTNELYLIEGDDFIFPNNYYLTTDDTNFEHRVLTAFKNTEKKTTGVLLSGLKGSGKTLFAKHLAKASNLPILVVDKNTSSSYIEAFCSKFKTDVCIIFDEIDKYWITKNLLGLFDGITNTINKLVICTCNDENEISKYFIDRCSRIRYSKIYKGLTKDIAFNLIKSRIDDETRITEAVDYIFKNVNIISFDNVNTIAEEMQLFKDDSIETIVKMLNLKRR